MKPRSQPLAQQHKVGQRPTQTPRLGVVQPKSVALQPRKTPAAPPVYRPQPTPKCLQLKAAPAGVRAKAGVQPKAPRATAFQVNRTPAAIQRAVIQRAEEKSTFDDFINAAWGAIQAHWEMVEETDPHAVEDKREESTEATFVREGFGPEIGMNINAHAE